VTDTITIRRPDDWHVHLRDGDMLKLVAPYTARQFARAIIMPNLAPPVTTLERAAAYRDRILTAAGSGFTPLMTCYLTDQVDPDELERGHNEDVWIAAKLYPAGATTNSAQGVTDIGNIYPALERMQAIGMVLCLHGEVTDPDVDVFDREAVFIDRVLTRVLRDFPSLKIVFEHITTRQAAEFVADSPATIAATITPQHLQLNRNALFQGGLRPHAYCLPVVKREEHRLAVRKAAVSGSSKFFLGTDSAPHVVGAKESSCGCAGLFNAPFALEAYAQVFDEEGALDRLEDFASLHGPDFYGLPVNQGSVTLERAASPVPASIGEGSAAVVPYGAGGSFGWRIAAA
jgi:dihydroorotase